MISNDTRQLHLELNGLTKRFGGFTALRDISLTVHEGEFLCFVGPSGCGKTTLLRLIAGLESVDEGRVVQRGQDVTTLPPAKRDFGIVFQSYALFPNLSVERNVAYGLDAKSGKAANSARVAEMLKLVGLPEQSGKYPAQLSGGQQQRVALARALAPQPGLLLLDEPLSALDAKERDRLRNEIREVQRGLGLTTVMVTHDQDEALAMADRIVVMNAGRIEQIGTPSEVYVSPTTKFVAGFVGETNWLDATVSCEDQVLAGPHLINCRPHAYPEGQKVSVAIRPEDVVLTDPAVDSIRWIATLEDVGFRGNALRCQVKPNDFDMALIAHVPVGDTDPDLLTVGATVGLSIRQGRANVFATSDGLQG